MFESSFTDNNEASNGGGAGMMPNGFEFSLLFSPDDEPPLPDDNVGLLLQRNDYSDERLAKYN